MVTTVPYEQEEIISIIIVSCKEEDVEMGDDALELLTRIGMETSFRYAIQMVIAASLVAEKRKSAAVEKSHIIKREYNLFVMSRGAGSFSLNTRTNICSIHLSKMMMNRIENEESNGDEEEKKHL